MTIDFMMRQDKIYATNNAEWGMAIVPIAGKFMMKNDNIHAPKLGWHKTTIQCRERGSLQQQSCVEYIWRKSISQ